MINVGKVTVNDTYYSGTDMYSDGEIEDTLLQIVKGYEDFNDIIRKDGRWPILYHLSSAREYIIDWFPFRDKAQVLEIGAGCGAITGALCRKSNKVTALELSMRRSMINAHRHEKLDNLEIMVGNFEDVNLEGKSFDYITLIGVFEYAGSFIHTNSPYVDFLKKIRGLLKDEGKLLMAIENKFGMKYWAGCREDHTQRFFDGIEGYPENASVATFGKAELSELIKKAGYSNMTYYYPHPDYKFPRTIYSDEHLPAVGELGVDMNMDMDRMVLFNESLAFNGIIREKMFGFFANSFFVEIKK